MIALDPNAKPEPTVAPEPTASPEPTTGPASTVEPAPTETTYDLSLTATSKKQKTRDAVVTVKVRK